jgi:hypothetical protein
MAYVTRAEQIALIDSILDHVNNGTDIDTPDGFYTPREIELNTGEIVVTWNDWLKNWYKFLEFINTGVPQFTIYTKGNGKLPFYSFSALPGAKFCPGAGECLKWCYSFRAWRYPAAFFRQLQNTILLMSESGRNHLIGAFNIIPDGLDFRLYVDGDFDSLDTMRFWFGLLKTRPNINAYGYSKSWEIFTAYAKRYTFPDNYELNRSSGSKFANNTGGIGIPTSKLAQQIAKLPIFRGDFIAVPTDSKMPDKLTQQSEFNVWAKKLRERAKLYGINRSFVCPGKCGRCTPKGHACGSKRFKNVAVIIGIH